MDLKEIVTTIDGPDDHYHLGWVDKNGNGSTVGTFTADMDNPKPIPTHTHEIKNSNILKAGLNPHEHLAFRGQETEKGNVNTKDYNYG